MRAEAIADRLRNTSALEGLLWCKGFHPIWREFNSGLAAVGALDAIDIDLALVIL